jgi:hypothetical protein
MPAAKLIVISTLFPKYVDAIEGIYREQHVPMAVSKLAGKTKMVATKVVARGGPAPFHRIAVIHFPSMSGLQACAASVGAKESLANAVSTSTGVPPNLHRGGG